MARRPFAPAPFFRPRWVVRSAARRDPGLNDIARRGTRDCRPTVNLLAELAALVPFRDCPPEDLKELARAAPSVRFPAHTLVFTQGTPANGALLIVSGWCRSEVQSGERRIVLGRAGPGEIIGETGLYSEGMHRSATVVAEGHVDAQVRSVQPGLEALKA